jgi:UDP-N-acetylbacillosamine N-acetyltransferase
MNYLFGWNSVSEFILDEFRSLGVPIHGIIVDDAFLHALDSPSGINLVAYSRISFSTGDRVINCLGYKDLNQRVLVGERLLAFGVLQSFISKQAQVHDTASIAAGTVLLGDVVIERCCRIGKHSLLWGGSRVCHDSVVGTGCFFASGSIIGGACSVGHVCSVGFNSSIREKSIMPDGTKVGANRFWRPEL